MCFEHSLAFIPFNRFCICQELEKMQLKHQEELGKRLKMNINTEKKLIKEVSQVKWHFCLSCRKPRSDELKCLHHRAMRLNEKPSRQR